MNEQVVLVDENDTSIGVMDKLEAHQKGVLHRAFSIVVLNNKGELLLQRRALSKYHSAGLWTNTCCSHPRPDEELMKAAERRLWEEMGLKCELVYGFAMIYKAAFPNGLTEHEYDHIIFGWCNDQPVINREEAEEFKYMSFEDLRKDISEHPSQYTEWFKLLLDRLYTMIKNREGNEHV